jgi:hypothetical protein
MDSDLTTVSSFSFIGCGGRNEPRRYAVYRSEREGCCRYVMHR